ncbi:hypothetical protein I553_3169 [Mycobacterium xenopi 4042]|uniref:Uncharacterized protein n=1 Tax=Mycobacterium xenopi 4042 TaxID=1299334 RepID=X8E346_MYCXE|nr:hypothetical protein I553_3169 [Mycobacterium xenopi 4042]
MSSPVVAALTSVIDPLRVEPVPPPQRRLIVGAWHDRMAMREPALALQQRWAANFTGTTAVMSATCSPAGAGRVGAVPAQGHRRSGAGG